MCLEFRWRISNTKGLPDLLLQISDFLHLPLLGLGGRSRGSNEGSSIVHVGGGKEVARRAGGRVKEIFEAAVVVGGFDAGSVLCTKQQLHVLRGILTSDNQTVEKQAKKAVSATSLYQFFSRRE